MAKNSKPQVTETRRSLWIATAVVAASLAVALVIGTYMGMAAGNGDVNGDGKVDVTDLSMLLSQYGRAGSADFNGNGTVDISDLSLLLSNYGKVVGGGGSTIYRAEFWNVPAFTDTTPPNVPSGTPTLARDDAEINFNWGGTPPGSGINTDYYVARWTANKAFEAGSYTFTVTADDGVRVYVDNVMIIDQWKRQGATTYTASRTMAAGTHAVKVEYYEQLYDATLTFGFSKDGTMPTPGPSPSSPPPTGNGPQPLVQFATNNALTTQLPANAALMDGTSQTNRRNELRFMVNASATGLEQTKYSTTIYQVFRNGDIKDSEGDLLCNGPLRPASGHLAPLNGGIEGRGWPTASCLRYSDGGENHMVLYNPETGAYGEFYHTAIGANISYNALAGYVANTRTNLGYSTNPSIQGNTASGVRIGGTVITEKEIRAAEAAYNRGDHANAYIPHVLGYEAYRHTPSTWEWPATFTDEVPAYGSTGPQNRLGHGNGIIPMGGIWRIAPSVDILQITGDNTPRGKMLAQIFARTLQKYGATMTDQTAGGVLFYAESAYHQSMYNYQHAGYNTNAWTKSMMLQAIDNNWVQFVNVCRNYEADLGQTPPSGCYRPGR